VLPRDPVRRAHPRGQIILEGRRVEMRVGDRLTGSPLTRSIEGASTLTLDLWDDDRAVLTSSVLGQKVMAHDARVELDGLGYIAAGVSRSGATTSIVLESDAVAKLKRHGKDKPLRTSRDKITRAGFVAGMFRDAGVPVVVLDEAVIQPIGGAKKLAEELRKARRDLARDQAPDGRRSRQLGIRGAGLTVKDKAATQEQRRNIAIALAVADKLKAPELAVKAMLIAGIAEGQWVTARKNPSSSATGPFQILDTTADALHISQTDVKAGAETFLTRGFGGPGVGAIGLARAHPDWAAGVIASMCEAGGVGQLFYDVWQAEARRWIAAAGSTDLSAIDTSGITVGGRPGAAWIKEYAYERRRGESSWKAGKRLLDEVRWRLFDREGVIVIASDPALMRAQPSVSLTEHADGVDDLDFDWHRALRVAEMTGTVHGDQYVLDPGEVAHVNGLPQLASRWLIATVTSDPRQAEKVSEVGLRRPQDPKPEPASEVVTRDAVPGKDITGGDVEAVCKDISSKGYPYVWGGGHAKAGHPDRGTGRDPGIGYDCSGSCGAALAEVGLGFKLGDPIPGSGILATSWGAPGHGKTFTLFANADHVFIQGDGWRFDTGGPGGGLGPRYHRQTRDTTGFTPRHWPGL
jgi:hypothetical protein